MILQKAWKKAYTVIVVIADSRTFSRSKRVDLNVQWPVKVSIKPTDVAGNYQLSIQAREEYIDPASLVAIVNIESPDGKQFALKLSQQEDIWVAQVETSLDGIHLAHVMIEAIDQAGVSVKFDLGKFSMVGVYKTPAVESSSGESPTTVPNAETEGAIDATANADLAAKEVDIETEDSADWVMTSIIIGVSNLVILLIVGGVFMMLRRKSTPPELLLE